MLARLATRRAKPGGSYHLTADEVSTFMEPLDIPRARCRRRGLVSQTNDDARQRVARLRAVAQESGDSAAERCRRV